MPTSKQDLLDVLDSSFEPTVMRICNRLQKISSSHYEIIDFERHQEREEHFLRLICNSLNENDPDILKQHMIELADTRHNEGYQLHEVQNAIDIVEEELWKSIVDSGYNNERILDMLFELHRIMVMVRNQFAASYAQKQIDAQKRMNALKERFYIYRHDRKDLDEETE